MVGFLLAMPYTPSADTSFSLLSVFQPLGSTRLSNHTGSAVSIPSGGRIQVEVLLHGTQDMGCSYKASPLPCFPKSHLLIPLAHPRLCSAPSHAVRLLALRLNPRDHGCNVCAHLCTDALWRGANGTVFREPGAVCDGSQDRDLGL